MNWDFYYDNYELLTKLFLALGVILFGINAILLINLGIANGFNFEINGLSSRYHKSPIYIELFFVMVYLTTIFVSYQIYKKGKYPKNKLLRLFTPNRDRIQSIFNPIVVIIIDAIEIYQILFTFFLKRY